MSNLDQESLFLGEDDLLQIEKIYPDGLSSAQIIQIFQARGAKLSEPTFRKYVQLGLLPRCKRVGLKGKHRGSHGIYPCATVRRINQIKRLMSQGQTIEEIQKQSGNFRGQIDELESALDAIFSDFEKEILQPRFDYSQRKSLTKHLEEAKGSATHFMQKIVNLESQISWPNMGANAAMGIHSRGHPEANIPKKS